MADGREPKDLVTLAVSRLPRVYRKPNMIALVESVGAEMQAFFDAARDVLITIGSIDTALDAALNQWGKLIGESRDGLENEEYRGVLKARISADRSNGGLDTYNTILRLLLPNYLAIRCRAIGRATVLIQYVMPQPLSAEGRVRLLRLINRARAAGVQLGGVIEAASPYFGFADDPNAAGFGVGAWAELI